jgi:hypothetical protein
MLDLIPDLEAAGAKIIDVSSHLLKPEHGQFLMSHSGKALYYDNHHLTQYGALFVRDALATAINSFGTPVNLSN